MPSQFKCCRFLYRVVVIASSMSHHRNLFRRVIIISCWYHPPHPRPQPAASLKPHTGGKAKVWRGLLLFAEASLHLYLLSLALYLCLSPGQMARHAGDAGVSSLRKASRLYGHACAHAWWSGSKYTCRP